MIERGGGGGGWAEWRHVHYVLDAFRPPPDDNFDSDADMTAQLC